MVEGVLSRLLVRPLQRGRGELLNDSRASGANTKEAYIYANDAARVIIVAVLKSGHISKQAKL